MDPRNSEAGDIFLNWPEGFYPQEQSQFNDAMMSGESPYGNTAFQDFTTLDQYESSPGGLTMRGSTKLEVDNTAASVGMHVQHGPQIVPAASAETSSQDSSSDTSSRRKRKTTESPMSDATADNGTKVKQEDNKAHLQQVRSFDRKFTQPMNNLTLEQQISQMEFNSAASSPVHTREGHAMSLDAQMHMPVPSHMARFNPQGSPLDTINPGMFAMSAGQENSPGAATAMMFGQASPANQMFSTPPSDSPEAFNGAQNWNNAIAQNSAWSADFANGLASPNGISFNPALASAVGFPGANASGKQASTTERSPLHIGHISNKSRVETQIAVVMTLEKPPPGIEQLHLPLHTIAKSKLLAKEEYEKSKVLELHTMLVCTSAMHNPAFKEKALLNAAAQSNAEIQARAEAAREVGDEDRNDPKNVDEEDRPANGGEVRICSNCIQRERKRAGRKKTKREEEQQHWERFETERVVVFNSNEYLPFKPCDPTQPQQRDPALGPDPDPYVPPEGALSVSAAMRIACYCRHQSEKEGFRVIFTLKDHHGNVVAQEMSDSILITDDHKTHPQSFSTSVPSEPFYQQNANFSANGLTMSHSMVDMASHATPFTASRSAGNLQALALGTTFNPHSHVHPMQNSGFQSQATSATMTPISLSRPGSPTSAGQSGPNKKRKSSSSFHRKIPSGLTMTPRVDTSQPPSSNMPSAISMNSQFSPTNANFPGQMNPPFMTIPANTGAAGFLNSGPPTPSESNYYNFGSAAVDTPQVPNNQAYFSHPSSAVHSRASSPVLQHGRGNMAAYARQQPIQTSTNNMNARPAAFHAPSNSVGGDISRVQYPILLRVAPDNGPTSGGNEVAVLGENFNTGTRVMFGDIVATTTFVNSNSIVAIAPASSVAGYVQVSLSAPPGTPSYPTSLPSKPYRYVVNQEQMLTMALKYFSADRNLNSEQFQEYVRSMATKFAQSQISSAGMQQQGYSAGGTQRFAMEAAQIEALVLEVFDAVDAASNGSTKLPPSSCDLPCETGATMLSLACSYGMPRLVAVLLARGADADTRDNGGFTPLMHAALHGRADIFRMLVAYGAADPAMRSLGGYSALDLAPPALRQTLKEIVRETRRRRLSNAAGLRTNLSHASLASSVRSWDISSASLYESESASSSSSISGSPSRPVSRRPSTHAGEQRPVLEGRGELLMSKIAAMSMAQKKKCREASEPSAAAKKVSRGLQLGLNAVSLRAFQKRVHRFAASKADVVWAYYLVSSAEYQDGNGQQCVTNHTHRSLF